MKKSFAIGIIFLFILSAVTPIVIGYNARTSNEIEPKFTSTQYITQTDAHIWPMHKFDAQRTGRSPYDASQNKGGEKWKYLSWQSIHKTPTIDKDGIIYAGTGFDQLHAVYPNGTRKWKQKLDDIYCRVPTIASDGTIYFGNFEGFHAYYPNGTLKWSINKDQNFISEPVIDSNDTIYVGTSNGMFYAIYPNGTIKWEYYIADYVFYIALDKDENIYFNGVIKNKLFCFSQNGSLKWTYKEVNIKDGPVIDDEGTIYIRSDDLIALYPNGTVKWIFEMLERECFGEVSIAPDGTIIICGSSVYITALNPDDGSIIWQHRFEDWPHVQYVSTAAIGSDGSIYFAYDSYSDTIATVVALNPDGSLKWETSLTTDIKPYDYVIIQSDPSIGSDGTIYITSWYGLSEGSYSDIGYIHAIGMDNPKSPSPPIITGPSSVKLFRKYEYTLRSELPDGGDVYYWIDWDDEFWDVEYNNFWIGPYPSGEEVKLDHTWKLWRKHNIKVRAMGNDSLCSPWSYLEVSMSLNKMVNRPMLDFLQKHPNLFLILRHLLRL
jgi:hypothetical protein